VRLEFCTTCRYCIFVFGCQRVWELLKPCYINLHITLHSGSWLKCCMVGSLTSSFTDMLYSFLLDTLQLKIFILIRTCWLLVCCWLPVKISEFYALLKYFMIDNKCKYVVCNHIVACAGWTNTNVLHLFSGPVVPSGKHFCWSSHQDTGVCRIR